MLKYIYNTYETNQKTLNGEKAAEKTRGESAKEKCFQSGFKREIVAALCILWFSEMKNFKTPWDLLPKSLLFVCAGNKEKVFEFLVL